MTYSDVEVDNKDTHALYFLYKLMVKEKLNIFYIPPPFFFPMSSSWIWIELNTMAL